MITPEYRWWWAAAGFDIHEITQPGLYRAGKPIFAHNMDFLRRERPIIEKSWARKPVSISWTSPSSA